MKKYQKAVYIVLDVLILFLIILMLVIHTFNNNVVNGDSIDESILIYEK